ncbi:MAG: imidazole glycerol phosphate synthase subunit HisH [Pseudomonadota bacterium]|jgi:glutamine amidotransferase
MQNSSIQLALISAGGANFYSIEIALQRLGVSYQITNNPQEINQADGIILPGVGSASYAMDLLQRYNLVEFLQNYTKPLLGICLGMQLLYEFSHEGNVKCLEILPGNIQRFSDELIVPHMGWNQLKILNGSPLFAGINLEHNLDVYFVHSYLAKCNDVTLASCEYSDQFCAIAQLNNFYGMQFHPEKSGALGLQLLANFVQIVIDHKLLKG